MVNKFLYTECTKHIKGFLFAKHWPKQEPLEDNNGANHEILNLGCFALLFSRFCYLSCQLYCSLDGCCVIVLLISCFQLFCCVSLCCFLQCIEHHEFFLCALSVPFYSKNSSFSHSYAVNTKYRI